MMNGQDSEIAWGDEVKGLRVGISIEKNRYRHNEKPIILEIFITNVSDHIVRIIETHILNEFEFELLREGDELIHMTPQGNKVQQAVRELYERRIVVNMKPGTTHKAEPSVKLDEWFQLDKPGIYSVQVQRRDWQGKQGLLTGGLLTFVIAGKGDNSL